ncbi:MAG: LamG-like jellyroll fold domain-containing protein, partial [Thermoanaerobaculia bacterium]
MWKYLCAHIAVAVLIAGPGVGDVAGRDGASTGAALLPIPAQSDWTDYGTILEPGDVGEWDFQLFGAFVASAIKHNGTYFLYYQGACCYRILDDTTTFRAIGVATSPDGVNFTRYGGNPVITWFPNNGGEEGAVSSAVVIDGGGQVVFYYGANTEVDATSVNSDARLAISNDGLSFTDQGVVLDHEDPSVWGFGDELYPVTAIQDGGQWVVYYIPHGGTTPPGAAFKLGVGSGPGRMQLATLPATSSGANVEAWGMAGSGKIGPDTYALFINDLRPPSEMFVHTVSLAAPEVLGAPEETYNFPDFKQGTVFLDAENSTWYMYYRNTDQDRYGLKLAPAGEKDTTPPSAPQQLTGVPVGHDGADLSWKPATDAETGIVQYRVFRGGSPIATVKGWTYSDRGLSELTQYSYEVSAENTHGLVGPKSSAVQVTTFGDQTAPDLSSVSGSGSSIEVTAVFDESVDESSSETFTNYQLNHGVAVSSASLDPDLRTVTLTTSPQAEHRTYTLTTSGVEDRAQSPNTVSPPIHRRFTHSGAPGLVGCWRLDEGEGDTAFDTSNFGADGSLELPGGDPATWAGGKIGGALQFDGVDDIVTIPPSAGLAAATDGSHTFSIWARPASVPPNTANHNTYYSLITREGRGLYYTFEQKFMANIRLASGTDVTVESLTYSPGNGPDDWHHVAMVVDDVAKELRLYVDGAEVSSSPQSYSGALRSYGEADFFLGTSDPLIEKWDFRLDGTVDEARVYSRALETSEIVILATPPGSQSHTLLVELSGEGTGSVTSSPGSIDCGSVCEEDFGEGVGVGLTT